MPNYFERIRRIVMDPAVLIHKPEPISLASGELSHVFIDGKLAVANPDDLDCVGEAMFHAAESRGITFDAVGGLVLGAVPFTFAVAHAARCKWFMVRKEPKGRGTNRWIEGARIEPGMRVMIVDDVVTTGGSIRQAFERVTEEGGNVVFATTLVDRGERAAAFFESVGVPYVPILTYRDLDILPVGPGSQSATAASS
ncbi:MAG: orotate phosphoribosyltransferase [Acidimicrobiales bacterium]|nr:orotate phosphoribosyltransferase [Acidimicrobiales bacterium]